MSQRRIDESGWTVHFTVTESAGLKLHLGDYKKRRVFWDASLPFVIIDHQRPDVSIDDPSADPHGPFWFPLGAATLSGDVRLGHFRGGFELAADYEQGPFAFTQLWRFHQDGRMEPWLTISGTGLHKNHTYRPHWRFDFDVDGAHEDAVEHFVDGAWTRVAEEGWLPYAGERSPDGFVWRQVDFGSKAAISICPHASEDAELFAVKQKAGEWAPFTPRAGLSGQSYPASYVGAEPIDGTDICLWYVAHVPRSEAFPVTAGPWIKVQY
jgi:hypothetical protein